MYILMIVRQKERPVFALVTGAVFIVAGVVPFRNLLSVINWNVLLMITGTMIIVFYFIESQMPNFLADLLLEKSPNVMWVTILMSLFAGIISALIDNVATVLMVAPVGLAICKKLKIKPVGMILSVAVSLLSTIACIYLVGLKTDERLFIINQLKTIKNKYSSPADK